MTRKTIKKTKARPPAAQAQSEHARELLLKAAVPLFAKKGFAGTSVKDIAEKAGVNIALISYYFKGKEGLYRTCIENFGKHRLAATERILQPAQTREECRVRLEMFAEDLFNWFDEEPELSAIVQREAEMNFSIAREVFEQTFVKIFLTFLAFVKVGQTKDYLRDDFDVGIASQFFFSGLIQCGKHDDLTQKIFGTSMKDAAYRKKIKIQIVRMFFEGFGKAETVRGVKK